MNNSMARASNRFPIRKRVLATILLVALGMLAAGIATSIYFMNQMALTSEQMLGGELRRSLLGTVEAKASMSDSMLDVYVEELKAARGYVERMLANRDELVATGTFVDTPRSSVGKGVFALTTSFAHDDYDLEASRDEIFLYSHVEPIFAAISHENEQTISTIYLGTTAGLMISYDRWSYESAVAEPDFLVYDYTTTSWYREGLAAGDVIFTDLYTDAFGRGLTVTIAVPYVDTTGAVAGVIAADLDITRIWEDMVSMDLGDGSESLALDSAGMVISLDSKGQVSAGERLRLSDADSRRINDEDAGVIETKDAFYAFAKARNIDWTILAKVPRTLLMEQVATLEKSLHMEVLILLIASIALILGGLYISSLVSASITHPIEDLVEDMRIIGEGDLDHRATPQRNDEVGDAAVMLNEMVQRLKGTIDDLVRARKRADQMHALAHRDALTSLNNKTAYDGYTAGIQARLEAGEKVAFALCVCDCDNLKEINDRFGHDKGDVYLILASRQIAEVFGMSPVFRIGGDEFVVGLQGPDLEAKDALLARFEEAQRAACEKAEHRWEEVRVSVGVAVFEPGRDTSVSDTFRRADKAMYENKEKNRARQEPGAPR